MQYKVELTDILAQLEMQKRKETRAKSNRRSGYESGVLNTVEKKLGVSGGGGENQMVSRDDAMVASSSSLMKGIEGGKVGSRGERGERGEDEENKGDSGNGDPFTLGGECN